MKNLFIILFIALGLVSFTTTETSVNSNFDNSKILTTETRTIDDFPCQIRICVIENGRTICGPWITGDCQIVIQ